MRFHIKIIFLIMLISIVTVSNSKNVLADDIEKFANKLLNHYEYDDKITNYLKSFFSFGNDGVKNSSTYTINHPNATPKNEKSSIKIKSKNKLIYNFKNGQSIQMNPSDISEKIIYKTSEFSYLEFKEKSVFYGVSFDF